MKNKARIISICLICFIVCSIVACSDRIEQYTSPNGDNKITVKYDFVSRPSVFYKGNCIWKYPGSGFNEEADFEVEWIDNDTVKLVYNDPSHSGKYYEEFEIDLQIKASGKMNCYNVTDREKAKFKDTCRWVTD